MTSPTIPEPGDHLMVDYRFFHHHGICVEPGRVIQYAAPPENSDAQLIGWHEFFGADAKGKTIHETDLEHFSQGREIRIVPDDPAYPVYPPIKSVARARSRLGENGYNLWGNNCEHFVRWCRRASAASQQVNWIRATGQGAVLGALLGELGGPLGLGMGAGIGAMIGSLQHWLRHHPETPLVEEEFVTHLYLLYATLPGHRPLNLSLVNPETTAVSTAALPEAFSEGIPGNVLLYDTGESWLRRPGTPWAVTDRGIFLPRTRQCISFHSLLDIRSDGASLSLQQRRGISTIIRVSRKRSPQLAVFLKAAIAGTPLPDRDMWFPIPWWQRVPWIRKSHDRTQEQQPPRSDDNSL